MAETWSCPKCGKSDGVYFRVAVRGSEDYLWEPDGKETFVNNDDIRYTEPETGRCAACGALIRDLPTLRGLRETGGRDG